MDTGFPSGIAGNQSLDPFGISVKCRNDLNLFSDEALKSIYVLISQLRTERGVHVLPELRISNCKPWQRAYQTGLHRLLDFAAMAGQHGPHGFPQALECVCDV